MTHVDTASPAPRRRLSWAGLAAAAALVFGVALGGTVLVGAALRPDVPAAAAPAAPAPTPTPSVGLPVGAPATTSSSTPAPTTTSSTARSTASSPRTTEAPARSDDRRSDDSGGEGDRSRASRFGEELRDRILGRLGKDD